MKKFFGSMLIVLSIALVGNACTPSPAERSAIQTAIISTSDARKLDLRQTQDVVSTEHAKKIAGATATYEAKRVIISPSVEVVLVSHESTNLVLAGDTIEYLVAYEENHWSLPYEKRSQLRKMYRDEYVYYFYGGETVLLLEYYEGFAKFQFLSNRHSKTVGDIGWVRVTNIKAFATYY